jgi:hypothetical protein
MLRLLRVVVSCVKTNARFLPSFLGTEDTATASASKKQSQATRKQSKSSQDESTKKES